MHKPHRRNVEDETRPDNDGRNNRNQEARVEIVVVVDALQMENLDHLKPNKQISECGVLAMNKTDAR
jgi:hypothetical protein